MRKLEMIFFSKIFIRIDFGLIYAIFYIVLLFIFFISIELILTFYSDLFFYTIYFLISFIFFIVSVYSLYKLIKIWWKKDFTIFTKIVNSLSYGVIFAMYLYIFYAFGAVSFILFLLIKVLVYNYVEKTTLIINQETNMYEQSLVSMLASAVNFLAYTLFLFLGENQFSIIFIFYVKIVLLLLLMTSIYFFFIEFKKCYTWKDIVEFCKTYPGHAVTLVFYMVRMLSIVIGEVLCMRYGIPGGLLMMGGPGIIPTGNGKPPSSDDLSEEELVALEKTLRNDSPVVEQPKLVIAYQNTLPYVPSKDVSEFFEDVTVNLQAFKHMSKEQYKLYQNQYELHRKSNPELLPFLHKDFKEYLSCIYPILINCSDENGKITKFACPVEDKPIDCIIDGKGFQMKKVGNFSSGDLSINRTKYAEFIEDFDNINFRNQVIYKNLIRQKELQSCIQENPNMLQGQEMLKENTLLQPTRSWVRDYFVTATKNAESMRKTHIEIKQDGYIAATTKSGKKAGIEETITYKKGCPPIFKIETIKKGIKRLK